MTLFDRRFVIFAGKGGVGRTTLAAAFAKAASRRGKRVLLCQTKSKERLSHLFGCKPIGTEITRVAENLSAVNMTPEASLREYGAMVLHSKFVSKQVLENRVSRAFLHAVPGLEDYSMLGKPWYHSTEMIDGKPKWDLIVMDGPATGHIVTMLSIPGAILNAVPEGPLSTSARAADALLRDETKTRMVLVTLAEELPTIETIELAAHARAALGVTLGPVIVNRLYPARFTSPDAARALEALATTNAATTNSTMGAMLDAGRTMYERRRMNDRCLVQLQAGLPLRQLLLPYLFVPEFGTEALADLSERLEAELVATSA